MRTFLVLGLVIAVAGCATYAPGETQKASSALPGESFSAYVARHMEGHRGYISDDAKNYRYMMQYQGSISIEQGIELFQPYLTTYCSQQGGQIHVNDNIDKEGKYGSSQFIGGSSNGGLDTCFADGMFIAGLGYRKNGDTRRFEGFTVYSPSDWNTGKQELTKTKQLDHKLEQESAQREANDEAVRNNVRLDMTVRFAKPELGIYGGIGKVQSINRSSNTVTILALNIFNRDNSNATVRDVSIKTLRVPVDTGEIVQLSVNLN